MRVLQVFALSARLLIAGGPGRIVRGVFRVRRRSQGLMILEPWQENWRKDSGESKRAATGPQDNNKRATTDCGSFGNNGNDYTKGSNISNDNSKYNNNSNGNSNINANSNRGSSS